MKKKLWIGVVEVLTEPGCGDGDTRAFTNVVTWANSVAGYGTSVTEVFESARPIDSESEFDEEIGEIIERAKTNPKACIYATFHYYPSNLA
jgi:hypothetical protein